MKLATVSRNHTRQQDVGHKCQLKAVDVDHHLRVIPVGFLCQAGAIDQHIELGKLRWQPGQTFAMLLASGEITVEQVTASDNADVLL